MDIEVFLMGMMPGVDVKIKVTRKGKEGSNNQEVVSYEEGHRKNPMVGAPSEFTWGKGRNGMEKGDNKTTSLLQEDRV